MTKWVRVTAFGLMAAWLAAFAGPASGGPDPPPGKFSIGFQLSDGAEGNPPVGETLIFPDIGFSPNGTPVWGIRVHGWVSLPNPPGGGQSYWMVYAPPNSTTVNGVASTAPNMAAVEFASQWNGAGVAYWTMFIDHWWWDGTNFVDLPNGNVSVDFTFSVKTPQTNPAWVQVGTLTGGFAW